MKSYFKLLVTLFVLSTVLSCKSTKSTEGSPKYQLIENDEFSFKLLDTWFGYESHGYTNYSPKKLRNKMVRHQSNFAITSYDKNPEESMEDLMVRHGNQTYKSDPNPEISFKTTDSKYGKVYIKEQVTTWNLFTFKETSYYYNINDKIVHVTFHATIDKYDTYVNDFRFMLNSLSILKNTEE